MYKLEGWCTCHRGPIFYDIYLPPDGRLLYLKASSSDRPGFEDGIATSHITEVNGRVVTTASGSQYMLGEPDAAFVDWCLQQGNHDPRDPINPIKVHK